MSFFARSVAFFLVFSGLVYYAGRNDSPPMKSPIEHKRPDLATIFNDGNYSQYIDQFGTVARTAFDSSGNRIGTQIGTYYRGAPNGMVVEMTYLVPDADHPLGQAFDGAGNPMMLHTGPEKPTERAQPRGPRIM